jgi:hypothetical protein
VPVAAGTSHAVFLAADGHGAVSLRFFTAAGELPACGHGTVAALAVLADHARTREYETVLRAGGRTFPGRVTGGGGRYEADFDPGPVALCVPAPAESAPVLAELTPDLVGLREACDRRFDRHRTGGRVRRDSRRAAYSTALVVKSTVLTASHWPNRARGAMPVARV